MRARRSGLRAGRKAERAEARAAGARRAVRALIEQRGAGLQLGPPKSRAGLRRISLPAAIVTQLRQHVREFVDADPAALVFTGPTGQPIWRGNFNKLVRWAVRTASVMLYQ